METAVGRGTALQQAASLRSRAGSRPTERGASDMCGLLSYPAACLGIAGGGAAAALGHTAFT